MEITVVHLIGGLLGALFLYITFITINPFVVVYRNGYLATARKLPGPSFMFPFGTLHHFVRKIKETNGVAQGHIYMCDLARQYGDVNNFSFWFFNDLVVMLTNPLDVSFVLGKGSIKFGKGKTYSLLRWLLGNSLLLAEGDEWRAQRQLLNPAFHFEILSNLQHVIMKRVEIMDDILAKTAASNGSIDMALHLQNFTQDVIGLVGFGFDFHAQTEAQNPYRKALDTCLHESRLGMFRPGPHWLYWSAQKKRAAARQVFHSAIQECIDRKKKSGEIDGEQDILSFMLREQAKGSEGMDDQAIIAQCILFMFAGSDTTSTLMASAIYMLSTHPEAEAKLVEELQRELPDGEDMKASHLQTLPYLQAVIKETLRMYPSAPLVGRQNIDNQDITLPSGLVVPPRGNVNVLIWSLHRNFAIWGPDADEWKPDRWLNTDKPNQGKMDVKVSNAFVPFAAGQRNCIGQNLAKLEAQCTLAYLYKKYTFEMTPGQKPLTTFRITLDWVGGLHFTPKLRK